MNKYTVALEVVGGETHGYRYNFPCSANNTKHATEIALDAYPNDVVVDVTTDLNQLSDSMYTKVSIKKIYPSIPNVKSNVIEEASLDSITVTKLIEAYRIVNVLTFDGTILFKSLGFNDDMVECKVGKDFIKVGNVYLVLDSIK